MSTTANCNVWDDHPSLSASMEDFESHAFGPILSPPVSQPHLSFRSPVVSEYSDVSDSPGQESWSPPVWRKAGSGWFRHQEGLASPLGSREPSPLKDDDETDEEDVSAEDIPLPRSPSKGRSVSRSMSPQRTLATPETDGHNSFVAQTKARTQSQEPRPPSDNNCMYDCKSHPHSTTDSCPRLSFFRQGGRSTSYRAD